MSRFDWNPYNDPEARLGRSRPAQARHSPQHAQADGFHCRRCGLYVTTQPLVSGVQNRNHCPFCLWSRHLDLHAAGDRLSACKAPMRPIGLTLKQSRKKYAAQHSGEVMLIHECQDCGKLSINRLAADDDSALLQQVFRDSQRLPPELSVTLQAAGIRLLQAADWPLLARQFGS